MQVARLSRPEAYKADDEPLMQKATLALMNLTFDSIDHRGERLVVGAIVWSPPLRLDFRVYVPQMPDHESFIGPDLNLTEEIFDGPNLRAEILQQIEEAVTAARAYFETV